MAEEETGVLPKILIIDDSRMVRASLIKQIRHRFQIREEVDGEAGWETLLIDPSIRIVLTDLGMPRLDGFGLLERIRGSKVQRIQELPVVIISGDEDDEARQRALDLGANDFVSKGAGCAEMTARLESLLDLTDIRRSLALSEQNPVVDPDSGLATPAYLNHNGEQLLAQARRRQTAISVMVVEIDHYDQLIEWHGDYVANLITGKLAKILSSKVRREDTISQISGARFVVLSPSTSIAGCCTFALRLQRAMEKLVLTYRDERIRITVTVGISGSETDSVQSVEGLIGTATERVRRGIAAGGNRIVDSEGEVDKVAAENYVNKIISIDHALLQLRIGAQEDVMDRLPEVITTMMPLFSLLEERLHFGIPLGELENYSRK
ncbi:MAG: response regulator [Proteobacteria bacterium]|jgi:diguanylate cyclase (GGDEF)-like protein|nr:response regulator [Pseudomonadota bacterium]